MQLRQKERLLDKKRREALNKILDIKGSDLFFAVNMAILFYYMFAFFQILVSIFRQY